MNVESGHPILAQSAEENIRTWIFEEHKHATFVVTFRYQIEKRATCKLDGGVVVLHLPTDVQIKVKAIQTCDPTK